jgi:hypothetical protein
MVFHEPVLRPKVWINSWQIEDWLWIMYWSWKYPILN